jgi:hypothetical protein
VKRAVLDPTLPGVTPKKTKGSPSEKKSPADRTSAIITSTICSTEKNNHSKKRAEYYAVGSTSHPYWKHQVPLVTTDWEGVNGAYVMSQGHRCAFRSFKGPHAEYLANAFAFSAGWVSHPSGTKSAEDHKLYAENFGAYGSWNSFCQLINSGKLVPPVLKVRASPAKGLGNDAPPTAPKKSEKMVTQLKREPSNSMEISNDAPAAKKPRMQTAKKLEATSPMPDLQAPAEKKQKIQTEHPAKAESHTPKIPPQSIELTRTRKLDFTHTLDDTQPKNAPEPPEELLQEEESMPNDGSDALAGHAPAKDTLALDKVQAYLQQPGNYEVRIAPYVPSGLYETLEATPEETQTSQHISIICDKEDTSQLLGFRFKDSQAAYEFFRLHAYQDPAKPGPLLILAPLCALCGECATVITHDKLPSVSIFGSSGFMFHDACIARCDAHALQNQKLYGKDRHSIFTLTLYEALPTFLKTQRAPEGNITSISKRLKELLDADAASKAPALAAEVMAVVEEAAEVLGKAGLGTEAGEQGDSAPAGEEDDHNKDGAGTPQLDEEDVPIQEDGQEEEAEQEYTTYPAFVLIDPRLANLAEAIEAIAEATFGTDTSWKNDSLSNINILAGFACVARFLPPLNKEAADRASVPALNTFPKGLLGLKEQVFAPFGHPLAICPLK